MPTPNEWLQIDAAGELPEWPGDARQLGYACRCGWQARNGERIFMNCIKRRGRPPRIFVRLTDIENFLARFAEADETDAARIGASRDDKGRSRHKLRDRAAAIREAEGRVSAMLEGGAT